METPIARGYMRETVRSILDLDAGKMNGFGWQGLFFTVEGLKECAIARMSKVSIASMRALDPV
jgi:hypothetical protein